MKKTVKSSREQVVPLQVRDLVSAQGAQHVDNPAQAAMKDE
jgi:hypothetical protein